MFLSNTSFNAWKHSNFVRNTGKLHVYDSSCACLSCFCSENPTSAANVTRERDETSKLYWRIVYPTYSERVWHQKIFHNLTNLQVSCGVAARSFQQDWLKSSEVVGNHQPSLQRRECGPAAGMRCEVHETRTAQVSACAWNVKELLPGSPSNACISPDVQ